MTVWIVTPIALAIPDRLGNARLFVSVKQKGTSQNERQSDKISQKWRKSLKSFSRRMGEENMDGRKVAREVRLQYWSGIIQARNQSGQTIREYCGENGVNEKSYYYWQNRLREAACEALAVRQENGMIPTFSEIPLPLSKSNQHAAITIRTGDSVVEIGSDAAPALVEQVLRTLRISC